jgi:cyclophilin family peptidyl-prolyl cis-trans isomerase
VPAPKRQRQRQTRAREAAAAAARKRRTRQRAIAVAVFLVILLVLGVASVVSGGGGGSGKKASTAAAGPCPQPAGTGPERHYSAPPPMTIDPNKTYTAEMKTSKGTMVIALDPKKAPMTVNNFVFLARNRFYDCLQFPRVVPGFVAQAGSPNNTTSGDPGYKFADELPKAGEYKIGSLAMANSGPNTNGSQFFIITGQQGVNLPPQYSLFGQVTQGLDVVSAIDALGTDQAPNTPKQPVTIESLTIKET